MTTETTAPAGNGHALGRRPKSTQDDIIPIAWRLFEENGYEATTMSDIAAAVGVSTRQVSRLFAAHDTSVSAYVLRRRLDRAHRLLSQVTGLWQWRIRRHFRPDIFQGLSAGLLKRYGDAMGLSIEQLKKAE
jgi:AcrR family transcriptional regulator